MKAAHGRLKCFWAYSALKELGCIQGTGLHGAELPASPMFRALTSLFSGSPTGPCCIRGQSPPKPSFPCCLCACPYQPSLGPAAGNNICRSGRLWSLVVHAADVVGHCNNMACVNAALVVTAVGMTLRVADCHDVS